MYVSQGVHVVEGSGAQGHFGLMRVVEEEVLDGHILVRVVAEMGNVTRGVKAVRMLREMMTQ